MPNHLAPLRQSYPSPCAFKLPFFRHTSASALPVRVWVRAQSPLLHTLLHANPTSWCVRSNPPQPAPTLPYMPALPVWVWVHARAVTDGGGCLEAEPEHVPKVAGGLVDAGGREDHVHAGKQEVLRCGGEKSARDCV